jgi:hypothetical protein
VVVGAAVVVVVVPVGPAVVVEAVVVEVVVVGGGTSGSPDFQENRMPLSAFGWPSGCSARTWNCCAVTDSATTESVYGARPNRVRGLTCRSMGTVPSECCTQQ